LYNNESLTELSVPNLVSVGNGFLCDNESLAQLSLPNLTSVGNDFLHYNKNKKEILKNLKGVKNV